MLLRSKERKWIGPETSCSSLTPSALHSHLQQHPVFPEARALLQQETETNCLFCQVPTGPCCFWDRWKFCAPCCKTCISSHVAQSPQHLLVTAQLPLSLLDRDFMLCALTKGLRTCRQTLRPGPYQTLRVVCQGMNQGTAHHHSALGGGACKYLAAGLCSGTAWVKY